MHRNSLNLLISALILSSSIGLGWSSASLASGTQDARFVDIKQQILAGKTPKLNLGSASQMKTKSEINSMARTCDANGGPCQSDLELYVQALDDVMFDKQITGWAGWQQIKSLLKSDLTLLQRLQLSVTFQKQYAQLRMSLRTDLLRDATKAYANGEMDERIRVFLLSQEKSLPSNWSSLLNQLEREDELGAKSVGISVVKDRYQVARDLTKVEPAIANYNDGKFVGKPRIYMFCRSDRNYQCLQVIKDKDGKFRKKSDGTIWSQPALGLSRHNKIYSEANGHTPQGVFRIDGVMSETDDQLVFGKFRRFVLNFVGASQEENLYRNLIPASAQGDAWWKEAVVARNNGRGLFRVHGTGLRSLSNKKYYPLVPTSGCVAKRENKYGTTNYTDQRFLLDEMMLAQGLTKSSANELKILGLLYVVNIDDKKSNVTLSELKSLGVL